MLLDTGATTSVLKEAVLLALGYDPSNVTTRVPMTTGSAAGWHWWLVHQCSSSLRVTQSTGGQTASATRPLDGRLLGKLQKPQPGRPPNRQRKSWQNNSARNPSQN